MEVGTEEGGGDKWRLGGQKGDEVIETGSVQEEVLDQGWTCGGQGLEAAKRVSRTGVKAEMWISEASFYRDPEME